MTAHKKNIIIIALDNLWSDGGGGDGGREEKQKSLSRFPSQTIVFFSLSLSVDWKALQYVSMGIFL